MRTALQTLLKSEDHRLERRIVMALLLGLAFTIVVQFLSSTSIRHLLASDEKVRFNFELDNYLEDLDHQLISLESNLRSYIISDASSGLLGDIGSNMANAREKLAKISTMAADIQGLPHDVDRLQDLVELKMTFSEAVLDSFSRGGEEAAITLINTREGLRLRDSIIRITSSLRQLERQNITQTIEVNRNEAQEVSQIDYISTLLATGIVLLALFYFLRSIEYRKTIQSKLEEARREAERSAQVKEQFAANMSHEIRTPLHAVLSFSEMLTATNLNQEQKELTAGIQFSGENLLAIVNDILDFSKVEAGMVELEQIPFRVQDIWHRLERMLKPKAEAKGLQLTFNSFPRSSEYLLGDPSRLNQILINLIGNAIKFTEDGGVQIWGHLKTQSDGKNLLEIKVSDSGIGIAEDQIRYVFERFKQGDAATSRRFGGTGLGLAIVKQLVEVQGGTIFCQSQLGQGSTFIVRIPYEKADISTISSLSETHTPPNYLPVFTRILIAEDNPLNRRIMALHFQELGYPFDLADNGRQALTLTKQFTYDLIFLDIQMPEMDGYEVARQIRHRSGSAVPIIAITAHAGSAEKEKCRRFGMNDCLQKPFLKKDLIQLLLQYAKTTTEPISESNPQHDPGDGVDPNIDLAYLLSISNGKPERLQEMAEIFLDQVPKELSNVQVAIQQGDFNRLAVVAHSMQSTVAYMGMGQSLGPLLRELETQAKQKADQKSLLKQLDKLRDQMARAMELVRRQIGQN